jgi:hypothetical protein
MGKKFWVLRFFKVYVGVFILLFVIHLIKGNEILESFYFAIIWAFLSTSVFVGSRVYQSKKGIACELCNDIPKKNEERT